MTGSETLTSMHIAGDQIAAIFAGRVDPAAIDEMTVQLLQLMESVPQEPDAMSRRFMILGALAAIGRGIQM